MKILLISMQKDLDAIGLKYLHLHLLRNGYDSRILYLSDFNPANARHMENIRKFALEVNPGLIGMSLMSTEFHNACRLTKYLRSHVKSAPIIWGGIHPTIAPEDCLDYADYACVGEGEKAILDIANALRAGKGIKHVNNLCYRENGHVKRNPLYPLLEDLDDVVSHEQVPEKGFILLDRGVKKLDLETFKEHDRYLGKSYITRISRGCPFSCTYCCNNFISRLYNGNKIRKRSIPNVIREFKKALKENPAIEYIGFMDDCILAFNEDYLREFLTEYKEKIGKPFAMQSIPLYVTKERLEILKDAGLAWISLGLQSGSDRVCREIYKRKSLKQHFLKAAGIAKDLKIAAYYDLILDNPFETEADGLETVQTLMRTPKPFYMDFYSLTCYRGTELYEKVRSAYPESADDYLKKNYLVPHKNVMNSLIRSAAFVNEKIMAKVISLYRQDPKSIKFKISLCMVNALALFVLAPITYWQVMKLSVRGSFFKTLKILPTYFKLGLVRYLNQFKNGLKTGRDLCGPK